MIPQQRVEFEARVSADLQPKNFELGAAVYVNLDGSVTTHQTDVYLGRALGPGKLAATVSVMTQPVLPPKVTDAVTQLGDIDR